MTRAQLALVVSCAVCGLVGSDCTLFKGPVTPHTIDEAAVILCALFFKEQHPAMATADIEQAFCSAAKDIEPFLVQAKRAERFGGDLSPHSVAP